MITLKNKTQLDGIRSSCKTLSEMFLEVGPKIKEGCSTYDVDRMCEDFMVRHHVSGPCKGYEGYPCVSCVSVNDIIIHGIPSKKIILQNGDIVSLDVCIEKNGYISDSTHTYEIGKVSEDVHRLNEVTRRCLYLAIDAAGKKNARLQDIGQVITSLCKKYNYGIIRDYTGHGVGLELHEEPEVMNFVSPNYPNPRLREGMVLAIEPMISMGTWKVRTLKDGWSVQVADGSPSCHWEHTVAITDMGAEILTEL